MDKTWLNLLFNVVTSNFKISRGGILLLDGNPNGYDLAEYTTKKVDANIQMISTLKNTKYVWSMKSGSKFDTSMVVPMGMLVDLVNSPIGKNYSKSGKYVVTPFMRTLFVIHWNIESKTQPRCWWKIWERFYFDITQIVVTTWYLFRWWLNLTTSIWRESKLFWILYGDIQ